MATQVTCDYCGEPIEANDPYRVELRVWGLIQTPDHFNWKDRRTRIDPQAHYHASDERCCWALLVDKVKEWQSLPDSSYPYPHSILEERERLYETRAYREEQGRLRALQDADRGERLAHARAEWDAIGPDGQVDRLRSIFTDEEEWLEGREIVARINWLSDANVLHSGDDIRRLMRRLVADDLFEENLERGRYSYRPAEMVAA